MIMKRHMIMISSIIYDFCNNEKLQQRKNVESFIFRERLIKYD